MTKPLYEGAEWNEQLVKDTWATIDKIAKEKFGLDYYPEQIELISSEQMLDCYSSVAMPLMYNHWSFGKSFIQNEKSYRKGQTGLAYEVVINTNPCIAYLVENNTMTLQALVLAHALAGHGSFFKNNYLFKKWTDADTILDYLQYAKNYITKCEEQHGEENVEAFLDSCHSLQYNSVDKYKKPGKLKSELQYKRQQEWEQYHEQTFNDLWRTVPDKKGPATKAKASTQFPEENILYFMEKHSPVLETWQREICRIVRKLAQYFYPQMQTSLMNEGWACQKGDSEYLSPTGWKRIDEYEGGEVAQYNEDGTVEYVTPTNYIVEDNKELIHFEGESFDQCVTPDHRIPYITSRGNLNVKEAALLPDNGLFIKAGRLKGKGLDISELELRLMVAISADGHFIPRTNTNYVQMGFTKERKINRLEWLLKETGIEYKKTQGTQGRTWINFYAPERNKQLSEYYSASQEQLNVIVEEATKWDGTEKSGRSIYFGNNKNNADFIQWAMSMTGSSASLRQEGNLYIVEKLLRSVTCIESTSRKELEGLHTVYCFTVPSGMFMTRRNDKVSVTGNCFVHHMLMTEMHDQEYLTDGAYLEFLHNHSNVVAQPNWTAKHYSGINIYALGFAMFEDIRRICSNPTEEDRKWFPNIVDTDWLKTTKYVMMNFRDESFVLQFLSPKIIRDFKLFTLEFNEDNNYLEVAATHDDDDILKIRKNLAEHYDVNKRVPKVEIVGVDWDDDRTLHMEYTSEDDKVLEYSTMSKTVGHIRKLWGFDVEMNYVDKDGNEVDIV